MAAARRQFYDTAIFEPGQFDDAEENPVEEQFGDAEEEPNVTDLTRLTTLEQVLSAGQWKELRNREDVEHAYSQMSRAMPWVERFANRDFTPLTDSEYLLFNKLRAYLANYPSRLQPNYGLLTLEDKRTYNNLVRRSREIPDHIITSYRDPNIGKILKKRQEHLDAEFPIVQ